MLRIGIQPYITKIDLKNQSLNKLIVFSIPRVQNA